MNAKTLGIAVGLALIAVVGAVYYFLGGQTAGNPAENSQGYGSDKTKVMETKIKTYKVSMKTDAGVIQLELYPEVAPKTVGNFVKLAKDGFYDGIKFHRVVPGFVIQGGDPLSKTNDPRTGSGGPGYQFEDEINPKALGLSDGAITQLQAAGYKYDFNLPSL